MEMKILSTRFVNVVIMDKKKSFTLSIVGPYHQMTLYGSCLLPV